MTESESGRNVDPIQAERVAANSFIQAARMDGSRDFQFGNGRRLWRKRFSLPFVDTDDDGFLGEKSFAMRQAALDHYATLPYARILSRHGAPGGGRELFAQMREYLTAANKEMPSE
jgi:hypothetical protein